MNGGATWDTSHRGCIMRKVLSKEVTAGRRFDFFLDSAQSFCCRVNCLFVLSRKRWNGTIAFPCELCLN